MGQVLKPNLQDNIKVNGLKRSYYFLIYIVVRQYCLYYKVTSLFFYFHRTRMALFLFLYCYIFISMLWRWFYLCFFASIMSR